MAQQGHIPRYTGENAQYTQAFDQARAAKGAGKSINPNDPSQFPEARVSMPPVNAHKPDEGKDMRSTRKDPARREKGITTEPQSNLPHRKGPKVPNAQSQPRTGTTSTRAGTNPQSSAGRAGLKSPLTEKPGIGRRLSEPSDDVVIPPFPLSDTNPTEGEKYTDIFNIVAKKRNEPSTPNTPQMNYQRKDGSDDSQGCGCMSCWFSK